MILLYNVKLLHLLNNFLNVLLLVVKIINYYIFNLIYLLFDFNSVSLYL